MGDKTRLLSLNTLKNGTHNTNNIKTEGICMSTLYKNDNKIANFVSAERKAWKVIVLLLTIISVSGFSCMAQNTQSSKHLIKGKVIAGDNGQPLPGVNIVIKGTTSGTATDQKGNYSIRAKDSDVLIYSFIGYKTKMIPVAGKRVINVTMKVNAIEANQLVVVGYGSTKKKDLTGAVTSVSGKDLSRDVTSSFTQALQGQVAGLTVTQSSGAPGGAVSVHIRGINTLGSDSQPLYVIDGVPVSGYSGNTSSPLASLNPQDIQSVEVLKDASSEAIYGSRAANGVILITTKHGTAGHTRVSYSGYYGVQQLPQTLSVMNLRQYAIYENARYKSLNYTPQVQFADPSILGNGTNWQNVLFRNAPTENNNLTISGGSQKTNYLLSANYFNQKGIAVATWFHRYALRFNLNSKPAKWLKVGTNLHLGRTKQRLGSNFNNIINTALRQSPDIPVYSPNGGYGGPSNAQFTLNNPLGQAQLLQNYKQDSKVIGNIFADINFTKNLDLRQEVDGTFTFGNQNQFTPTYNFGAITNTQNNASVSTSNSNYWLVKTYLTYQNTVYKQLDLKAMVGHEAAVTSYSGINASRKNFPTNNVHSINLGDASTAQNGGYKGNSSRESVFGRVNLSYKDRYLVTGTFRADASSKFSSQNQWAYFPSVAVAWRMAQEPFIKKIDQIDKMKLRLSYGQVGNQNIGDYLFGSTLGVFPTTWGSGLLPTDIANPNVQWESTDEYDAGLDVGLFNQRIQLSADIYLKRTHGLLLQEPLPLYSGTGATGSPNPPTVNVGSIQNKGFDLSINTTNVSSQLVWKTGLQFSMNRNKVLSLNQGNKPIDENVQSYYNGFDDQSIVTRTVVGQPIAQIYGYVVQGIIKNAQELKNHALPAGNPSVSQLSPKTTWIGDYKFKDLNGDGVINSKDRTFLGNTQPLFEFGISNKFYYKNFDLTVFLNGNYGNKIYNYLRQEDMNMSSNFNLMKSASNFAKLGLKNPNGDPNNMNDVVLKNPNTNVPRVTASDPNQNNRISSAFVEDGSYLRVQNVILGYTLPHRISSLIHMSQLRVYAQIQNLYTFTKYKGYDPNVAAGSQTQNALTSGMDYGQYPAARTFTFGINLRL